MVGFWNVALHAKHATVDPEAACLFLRKRAIEVACLTGDTKGARIRAVEVVALTSTAELRDGVTAMRVANRHELFGDFRNRGIPGDFFEGPVVAASQWLCQALRMVLVVVQPICFLAGISLRDWVGLVALNLCEMTFSGLHFNAAILTA